MQGRVLLDNPMVLVELGSIVLQAMTKANDSHLPIATYVMFRQHWIPLVVNIEENRVIITTDDILQPYVNQLCTTIWSPAEFDVKSELVPQIFANDCGFQTIGWLQAKLLRLPAEAPFTEKQAIDWRILYHEVMVKSNKHNIFLVEEAILAGETQKS